MNKKNKINNNKIIKKDSINNKKKNIKISKKDNDNDIDNNNLNVIEYNNSELKTKKKEFVNKVDPHNLKRLIQKERCIWFGVHNELLRNKNMIKLIEKCKDKDTKKINIKSKYEFYKNFEVLGKVSAYHLLVVDKNKENLPTIMYLFDFNKNEFIKRYYLNQNLPVLYHKLENWYKDSPVFLLLDNKMRLTQYYLDNEKTQNIKSLFSLDLKEIITKKNKDDNIILLNVGDNIFLFANNGLIFRINN